MTEINAKYKEYILQDLKDGTAAVVLLNPLIYTYNPAHQYLSDLPSNSFSGSITRLSGVVVSGKEFKASPCTILSVDNPDPQNPTLITQLLVVKDTGTLGTSRIVHSVTGLSINANGSNIVLSWADSNNTIFSL